MDYNYISVGFISGVMCILLFASIYALYSSLRADNPVADKNKRWPYPGEVERMYCEDCGERMYLHREIYDSQYNIHTGEPEHNYMYHLVCSGCGSRFSAGKGIVWDRPKRKRKKKRSGGVVPYNPNAFWSAEESFSTQVMDIEDLLPKKKESRLE